MNSAHVEAGGDCYYAYIKLLNVVDLKKKYVRVTGVRDNKLVEFDFSIDDPEIFVELVLPLEMFQIFCEKNEVEHLPAEDGMHDEYKRMIWRMGDARKIVFKS